MTEYKACIDCKQIKILSNFVIDNTKKSGYKAVCLVCNRIRNNYKGNLLAPRKDRASVGNARDKKIAYLDWVKANPDRRRAINKRHTSKVETKAKRAQQMREYRLKNPDAYQNWVIKNPDKANANWNRRRSYLNEASIYQVTNKEISKLYQLDCIYCGSNNKIQIDHIIPISRGGKHSIGNLAPCCSFCNQSKGNKTITEWGRWKNAHKRVS